MSFAQLHYTSCKNGLASYDGFQFCAMTPGLPVEVLREVEKLTMYELPPGLAESGERDSGSYPVNLLYTLSERLNLVIIARVEYAGRDFSDRPGNYFAHTLVAHQPDVGVAPFLPVELWDAPFWQARRSAATELPALAALPGAGSVTASAIDSFIAAEPWRIEFIKALLTAADIALSADRKILIISADSDVICRCIAAVCYLLGPHRGPKLTFATYAHDLRHVSTCIVGALPGVVYRAVRGEIDSSFWIFDVSRAEPPDMRLSPAAVLLGSQGIASSRKLWDVAVRLGAGPEDTLDDLFPLLAGAALIEGRALRALELDAAVEWLHRTDSGIAADRLDEAVSAALRAPWADIPSPRQEQLVDLAERADSRSGRKIDAAQSMTMRVEFALAETALRRLDSGDMPDRGFPFRTARAKRVAAAEAGRRLSAARPSAAIVILRWAHAVGADPGTDVVGDAGRKIMAEWPLDNKTLSALPQVAADWPALRAGIVDGLADLPVDRQPEFFASDVAAVLEEKDFAGHPALGEAWLISAAQTGRMARSTALVAAARLRRTAGAGTPAIDESLIARIWRDKSWSLGEGTELITQLPPEELTNEHVARRLTLLLRNPPRSPSTLGPWTDYAATFASAVKGVYPDSDVPLAAELADMGRHLQSAYGASTYSDAAVESLMSRYAGGGDHVRLLLDWHLPRLMLRSARLYRLLHTCPDEVFAYFCDYALFMLENGRCELPKIATIFLAMANMGKTSSGSARSRELRERSRKLHELVLHPVLSTWTRHDINKLARTMDDISHNSSSALEIWYLRYGKKGWLRWRRLSLSKMRSGGELWPERLKGCSYS